MTVPEVAAPMEDYRPVLRKVGTVLVVVGLLDIAWMVYCLTRWWSYSSSFNVFAVIAGILLIRGSLPTARVVALFSAFFFTGFAGVALIFPIAARLPLELAWLSLRLHPLPVIGFLLFLFTLLALLWWTYRMLTKPAVLAAMDQQQINYRHWRYRPSSGFIAGALLAVVLGSTAIFSGGVRHQVEEEARRKVGEGYRLWVSSMSVSSTAGGPTVVQAEVVAYDDHEIRTVPVAFERQ